MATCFDCANQVEKTENLYGFPSKIPYCGIGVTNRIDDPNRKDGKCQKFKPKGCLVPKLRRENHDRKMWK